MKQGRTLEELAKELQRQLATKKDFKSPTGHVVVAPRIDRAEPNSTKLVARGLEVMIGEKFKGGITSRAHQQLGQYSGIPSKYYDRMRTEAPNLLAANLNHWLHEADSESKTPTHLFRTLDGNLRAMLSNRYRTIDNFDVAETVLPILIDHKVSVVSSEVTEDRLYVKAVSEKLTFEVKKGDVVQMGIVISNSETGCGSVRVEPLLYRLICLNGAIIEDAKVRKFHVGRMSEELESAYEVYRDETRKADDRAFMLKVRDVVKGAFDEIRFREIANTTKDTEGRLIPGNVEPTEVVEVISERFHFGEDESKGILNYLIRGGSLTQWGLANAVTSLANDQVSYEHATRLERIGGSLISLDNAEWRRLMTASGSQDKAA
jgi:hypothetical protein